MCVCHGSPLWLQLFFGSHIVKCVVLACLCMRLGNGYYNLCCAGHCMCITVLIVTV